MKKTIEKKFYICPSCKKKQGTINHYQKATTFFIYDINRAEFINEEAYPCGGEVTWECPECEEELPYKIYSDLF